MVLDAPCSGAESSTTKIKWNPLGMSKSSLGNSLNMIQKIPNSDVEIVLKLAKRSAEDVFNDCKDKWSTYKNHKRGWSNDKEKTMRHVTSIPAWVYFDPEHSKYFDPRMGKEDRKKSIDKWIKKYDWFDFRKI